MTGPCKFDVSVNGLEAAPRAFEYTDVIACSNVFSNVLLVVAPQEFDSSPVPISLIPNLVE